MDSQETLPNQETVHTPRKSAGFSRFLLFGSIVLIAIVSVALAVTLPKSTDDRSKAASSASCNGKVTVAASTCNGKCGVNEDCMGGMICYKTGTSTEGVCRSATNPTSTTCSGTVASASPAGTPVSSPGVCTQTCDLTVANSCPTGKTCVAPALNFRTTTNIYSASPQTATAAQLASMPAGRTIIAAREAFEVAQEPGVGRMTYRVMSKTARTFNVKLFRITGIPPALDPQVLVKTQSISIAANSLLQVKVEVPSCGRYQVDFELPSSDPGSLALVGTNGYFWGDNQLTFKCPGCCQ